MSLVDTFAFVTFLATSASFAVLVTRGESSLVLRVIGAAIIAGVLVMPVLFVMMAVLSLGV